MMHIDLCLLDLVPSMSKISRLLQEIVGGKSQSQSLNTTRPRPSSSVPGPSGWSMMVDGQIWAFWGLGACLSMLNTRFMNSWFVQLGDTCLGADYPHPWVFSTRVSMDCMGDFFFPRWDPQTCKSWFITAKVQVDIGQVTSGDDGFWFFSEI